MDRGNLFHEVYRVEQRLGRVLATIQPYPLYPVTEYFGGVISRERIAVRVDHHDEEDYEEQLAA